LGFGAVKSSYPVSNEFKPPMPIQTSHRLMQPGLHHSRRQQGQRHDMACMSGAVRDSHSKVFCFFSSEKKTFLLPYRRLPDVV
jgi:hypothetical protein